MAGMGQTLAERMQPGDLLLIEPPAWGGLYRYYLPMDDQSAGSAVDR